MDERKNYTVMFEAQQTYTRVTFTDIKTYSAAHAEREARLLLSSAFDWKCVGIDTE